MAFKKGHIARARGLQARPELNGVYGIVVEVDERAPIRVLLCKW